MAFFYVFRYFLMLAPKRAGEVLVEVYEIAE